MLSYRAICGSLHLCPHAGPRQLTPVAALLPLGRACFSERAGASGAGAAPRASPRQPTPSREPSAAHSRGYERRAPSSQPPSRSSGSGSSAPAPGVEAAGGSRPAPRRSASVQRPYERSSRPQEGAGKPGLSIAPQFLALQGLSVQQLVSQFSAMSPEDLMALVQQCPYGVLTVFSESAQDLVRSFILALTLHLEGLVGHAPPYARLPPPYAPVHCDSILNVFKQNRHLTRPSLPLVSALLLGCDVDYPVRAQRALANALALGVQCPAVALGMEAREVQLLREAPARIMGVGPKSLRNILGVCKSVRMAALAEAMAEAFLQVARPPAQGTGAGAAKRVEDFWRTWRSPERCPNPNLYTALLTDLGSVGARVGTMRELVPAMGGRLLLGGGAGGEPPARTVSIASHALLLRTLASLALDEQSVSAGEVAAWPGRGFEGFLAAARPLLLLATQGINAHFQATPPEFFHRLVAGMGSYNARTDAGTRGGEGPTWHDYADSVPMGPGDEKLLLRWMRNVPQGPQAAHFNVHKITVDLGVLATACALLETLRADPRAAPHMRDIPAINPALIEPVLGALGKARAAEEAVHATLLTPVAAASALSSAAAAAEASAAAAAAAAAEDASATDFSTSLSWMQQLITLRVYAILVQVAALAAEAGSAGSAGSLAVSGVPLTPAQLTALHSLGLPSPTAVRVLDYSLDLAWPAAHLGLEVDGPGHFQPLSAAEMDGALSALGARRGELAASLMAGEPDGTIFFSGSGLPTVADWSVPKTRYKVGRVALAERAAAAAAAAAGAAGGGRAATPAELTGEKTFAERVRLQALARNGWRLVHVNFEEVQRSVPVMVKFLTGGGGRQEGGKPVPLKGRSQFFELSVPALAAAADSMRALVPDHNPHNVVQATAALDAVIIRALLEKVQ